MSTEIARLKRQLAERDEELAILQRPRHTSRSAWNEVCLYWKTSGWVQHQSNVPRAPGGPQRLVYVVSAADKDKHASAVPPTLRQRCPRGFYPVKTALRCPTPDGWTACSGLPFNVKPWRQACAVRDWGQRPPGSSARSATAPRPACVQKICWSRIFTPVANQKWAGDITYLRTDEGWLYLAVVIDLWSRCRYWLVNVATHDGATGLRCPADGAVAA